MKFRVVGNDIEYLINGEGKKLVKNEEIVVEII